MDDSYFSIFLRTHGKKAFFSFILTLMVSALSGWLFLCGHCMVQNFYLFYLKDVKFDWVIVSLGLFLIQGQGSLPKSLSFYLQSMEHYVVNAEIKKYVIVLFVLAQTSLFGNCKHFLAHWEISKTFGC